MPELSKGNNSKQFLFAGKVGLVAIGVCLLDFATKAMAAHNGWMAWLNNGISFGIWPEQSSWWSFVTIIVLMMFVVWGWPAWSKNAIFLGLLVGGGLANAIDRIMTGAVRDWLPIPFTGMYNNLADYAIFIALCWFIAHFTHQQKKLSTPFASSRKKEL